MMKGAIIAACEGNLDAARQIEVAAELFLSAKLPVRLGIAGHAPATAVAAYP